MNTIVGELLMEQDTDALVSIVIPAYNVDCYIEECIESIMLQSYKNLQIILINDGSTDRTGLLCDDIAKRDGRILVVHQENKGVSAARNLGILLATGAYLAFVDSDDTLPRDCINILVQNLVNESVDVVYGNFNYIYEGKILPRKNRFPQKANHIFEFINIIIDDGTLSGITFGSVCGALYKTEVIRSRHLNFREHLKINEDGVFNIEYCLQVSKISYISQPVYNYRQKNGDRPLNIEMIRLQLTQASEVIENIILSYPEHQAILMRQIKTRKLFCVFQNSFLASALPKRKAILQYHSLWNDPDILKYRSLLNFSHMNYYRKILWRFIENKNYLLFYYAIHNVYPLLRSIIKR